jgi:ribulose 1,5-bisphosphate carboxylase large subunit-like protein
LLIENAKSITEDESVEYLEEIKDYIELYKSELKEKENYIKKLKKLAKEEQTKEATSLLAESIREKKKIKNKIEDLESIVIIIETIESYKNKIFSVLEPFINVEEVPDDSFISKDNRENKPVSEIAQEDDNTIFDINEALKLLEQEN